jgi:hypothetical protein
MIYFIGFVTLVQIYYLVYLHRLILFQQEYCRFYGLLSEQCWSRLRHEDTAPGEISALYKKYSMEAIFHIVPKFWVSILRTFEKMEEDLYLGEDRTES